MAMENAKPSKNVVIKSHQNTSDAAIRHFCAWQVSVLERRWLQGELTESELVDHLNDLMAMTKHVSATLSEFVHSI